LVYDDPMDRASIAIVCLGLGLGSCTRLVTYIPDTGVDRPAGTSIAGGRVVVKW
jgi:hypothetical protein